METPLEGSLFFKGQYVRCIDSSGTFADGTPLKLIEGKRYQVKAVRIIEGNVLVELFMLNGLFMADRFMSEQEYNELENEIFNLMKNGTH